MPSLPRPRGDGRCATSMIRCASPVSPLARGWSIVRQQDSEGSHGLARAPNWIVVPEMCSGPQRTLVGALEPLPDAVDRHRVPLAPGRRLNAPPV